MTTAGVQSRRGACAACVLLAAMAVAPGCVTEKVKSPSRGTPVQGLKSPGKSSTPPPKLPDGPVASPAPGHTTSSRVQVAIAPVGRISYDGQALPLTSPDGKYIAVQQGEPPTWETILAENGAELPLGVTIAVYDTSRVPPSIIEYPQALPQGMLVGRAADDAGFLVEAPRPNGARWIGRVSWSTGELDWLVTGDDVNAHAVLTPRGQLVFTRRAVSGSRLVLRTESGVEKEIAPTSGDFMYPLASDSDDLVHALRRFAGGLEICAIRFDGAAPRLGPVLTTATLSNGTDAVLAHQAAAYVQQPFPRDSPNPDASTRTVVFHPAMQRMVEFNPETSALMPLAPRSMAAVAARQSNRPGYFCTTPDGLLFTATGTTDTVHPARIVAGPMVARRVRSDPPTLLLFGPVEGRPDVLEVVRLNLGPSVAEGADSQ